MADIVTSRIFTDGERGITAAKLNDIVGSSVIQPAFYSAKPSASSLAPTDVMLALKAGAYVQAPFQTVIDSVSAGLSSDTEIWSVRLRSFNAVNNPTFEVDQRTAGTGTTFPVSTVMPLDRWVGSKTGTMTAAAQQLAAATAQVPGTSFSISRNVLRVTVTGQQASLGAGDFFQIFQYVEGPNFRELSTDVHSISLLVRSTVASLKIGIALRDSAPTKSLTKLVTLPSTASQWMLVQLPNLPVWPAGNFSSAPGVVGYILNITLAAGSTFTAAANDTWQTANVFGAIGQDNFFSKPVNSFFDVALVQHEPGPVCSTPMDKPFTQNLDECLRYFSKSNNYAVKPGTVDPNGIVRIWVPASGSPATYIPWKKIMAKTPTVTAYSPVTGTANAVRDETGVTDRLTSSTSGPGESGFTGFTLQAVNAAASFQSYHFISDTGW